MKIIPPSSGGPEPADRPPLPKAYILIYTYKAFIHTLTQTLLLPVLVPQLAWIQRDRSAILTVGNHVITRNNRIGVSHDGHRTWYLTIKDVRQGDAGTYMCQINTEVAVSQVGHVSVVGEFGHEFPPLIRKVI